MRYLKLTIVLLLFTAVAHAQQVLPSVNVKTLDGKSIMTTDLVSDHEITVFSFWATWCKPCKLELDNLADLYPDWKADYNVKIIAVTIDTERALRKVAPLVEAKQWDYLIVSDKNRDFHKAIGGVEVPFTAVVQNGKIVHTHSGYKLGDEDTLESKIKELKGK